MFGPDMIFAIPGLLLAMTIHEYAHARVAVAMGDFTPRMTGRLTLNPVAHIDPIGLLMLFFAQFGWAKPVMINARNFKDWRKGELYVSLAGPAANLVTAFIALLLLAAVGGQAVWLYNVLKLIVLYNINFAVFNMIPLPPLDGSKVLMSFLPGRWAYELMRLERYSFLILIALMMTPVLSQILIPLQRLVYHIFYAIIAVFF